MKGINISSTINYPRGALTKYLIKMNDFNQLIGKDLILIKTINFTFKYIFIKYIYL